MLLEIYLNEALYSESGSEMEMVYFWFISVDICSDGLNLLRNSDLFMKKIYSFLRQNVSSKFLTLENYSFRFEGANELLKLQNKIS